MSKRHARLLAVTYEPTAKDGERILWLDFAYDQTMQLPMGWGLWRADAQRITNDGEDEGSVSPDLAARLKLVTPHKLWLYVMHRNTMYRGSLSALTLAEKLQNGVAQIDVQALPVSADSRGDDDSTVGISSRGFLMNMSPADALSVFDGKEPGLDEPAVASHPLLMGGSLLRELSLELPAEPQPKPPKATTMTSFNKAIASLLPSTSLAGRSPDKGPSDGDAGAGGDKADGGKAVAGLKAEEEAEDVADMNAANNPVVQLLMGGIVRPGTPALLIHVTAALYPVHPALVGGMVKWQQQHGLLPRSNVRAAWKLSKLSTNRLIKAVLPPLAIFTVVALWVLLYLQVVSVRVLVDDCTAWAHAQLPSDLQERGSMIWHALLPSWLINKVAPGFLAVLLLIVMPVLPLLLVNSARILAWWLHAFSLSPTSHGTVYGMTVTGCTALTLREWDELSKDSAERPDMRGGIANAGWITDDVQERYFQSANRNEKQARSGLASTANWRKQMGIDGIFESKQPFFHVMKKAFPHGILALSKSGSVIYAMKIGALIEQYHVLEESKIGNDDIVKHLALIYEWMFRKVDTSVLPGGRIINVIDMQGLSLMDTQSKAAKLSNLATKISANHYPDRLDRAILINCPSYISQMWGVAKNMLDKNAQDRTSLFTKGETLKGLREEMADEDIPKEYGGSRPYGFYHDKHEVELFKHVAKVNGVKLSELKIDGMFEPKGDE